MYLYEKGGVVLRRDPIKFLRLFFMIFSGIGLIFTAAGIIAAVLTRMSPACAFLSVAHGALSLLIGLIGLFAIARRARLRQRLCP